MNPNRFSKITHSLSIILLILVLVVQNTPALPGYSNIQPALAANDLPGLPGDWLAQAQEQIRQSEYNLSWTDQPLIAGAPASYQAPNRAQNLRFYFQEHGLQAIPRSETEPGWVWGLSLSSYGRGDQFTTVEQPALEVTGNQVIYHRQELSEVYTNNELGLLHTLHLTARPANEQETLVLRMQLSGDLTAHTQIDGGTARTNVIEFRHHGLPVLSYGNLKAQDANGRFLPIEARLDACLNEKEEPVIELHLLVDDQQAAYPLDIEGLLNGINFAWAGYIDHAAANYGFSVATAGDVNFDGYSDILIGAPNYDYQHVDDGAAFLYFGSPDGPSIYHDWVVRGNATYSWLGYSVATAGDVNQDEFSDIIIGAPRAPGSGGMTEVGIVYVFYGSHAGPGGTHNWSAPGEQEFSMFGNSVATAGDVNGDNYSDVIIGARSHNEIGETISYDTGKVYIYHGSASGLSTTSAWSEVGYWSNQFLGWSVATAGDVNADGYADVLVGAPVADTAGMTNNGFVYLYYGTSGGLVGSPTLLEGDGSYWEFGTSVSTAGDVNGDGYADIIIGLPMWDVIGGGDPDLNSGAAYVYYGSAPEMDTVVDWIGWSREDYSQFGASVATAGDVNGDGYADIIIGQPLYDSLGGPTDQGRALVWYGGTGGLGQDLWNDEATADWSQTSGNAAAEFGHAVATAGDVNGDGYSDLLIGAPSYEIEGIYGGVAFAFYGGADNLINTPGWTYRGDYENINLGYSVASAGDINGDGFADILAGAPYYDSGYTDEGAIFVWHGSALGLSTIVDWWARGQQADARFGHSIDSAGDVNGDGYSDIIVGAPYYDNGSTDEGMVFVWLGSPSGLGNTGDPTNADWKADSNFFQAFFGTSVATAGDVNLDGYGDIAAGAPDYENGLSDQGRVMVWHGGPNGLGASFRSPNWYEDGYNTDWHLGTSLAGAGDVNRDNYSDLIAGGNGLAMAWHGSANGLNAIGYDWLVGGVGLFGVSVDTAGDINGDGYSDVIIGAPWYTDWLNLQGMAVAYSGSSSGLQTTPSWKDYGEFANAWFGWSVSCAGDVNGDGYADILVGAPTHTRNTTTEGQVRLYYGSNWGPVSFNGGDWTYESNILYAYSGWSVSSAGDVNGDGFADVLVGASGMINDRGEVQLFYGNGVPGKPWQPRQLKTDCTTPLHSLGVAGYSQSFCFQITAFNPMGRGQFGLMYESKSLMGLFNNMFIEDIDYFYDTSTNPTQQNVDHSLAQGKRIHWRVRIMHSPITSPFAPPRSRWLHIPWNGWNEADFYQPYAIFLPLLKK